MLSGFLVGLFSPNTNEFLEDVSHLHVVNTLHGQVYTSEHLDDFIQQVLFVHARNVVTEPKTLDDLLDILREAVYVGIEILSEQVRIIQQSLEIELRRVVERSARSCFKKLLAKSIGMMGVLFVGGEHRLFWCLPERSRNVAAPSTAG